METKILLCFCALLLLQLMEICPVHSIALNFPANIEEEELISNSVVDAEEPTITTTTTTTSSSSTTTAVPSQNCSKSEIASKRKRHRTPEEKKRIMFRSIRNQLLVKLDLNEPPQRGDITPSMIPESIMSAYRASQYLQRSVEKSQDCKQKEEMTLYSKHLRLYSPDHYSPVELPLDDYESGSSNDIGEDRKGDEIKESSKPKTDPPTERTTGKTPFSPPSVYNLRFDDLDLANSDLISSVKLELFKRKAPSGTQTVVRGINPVENVKVYQVMRTFAFGSTRRYYKLLTSKNVHTEEDGYESFNITSAIIDWMEKSPAHFNLELDIVIDTPEMVDTGVQFPPVITFDVPSYHKGEKNARLLVEKLDEKELSAGDSLDTNAHERRQKRAIRGAHKDYCFTNPNETNCCVRDLEVNFERDLGITGILFPRSFHTNYCNGACQNPYWPAASNSTKYLIKLRRINPTAAPEPCCVPHTLSELEVIMVINRRVVMRKIPGMIVDSCICR